MLWLIAVFRITERSSRLHWCIDMWCHERTFRTRSYRFAVFFLGNLRVKIIIKKNNLQNFALTFLSPGVVSLNNSTELFVRRIYSPPPSTVATAADILFSSLLPLFYLTYSCLDVSQKLRFFWGGGGCLSLLFLSRTNSGPFVPVGFQRPLSFKSMRVVQGAKGAWAPLTSIPAGSSRWFGHL